MIGGQRRAGIFYRKMRHQLSEPLAFALISRRPTVFIAAWPRSGSTWLRTMLSTIRRPESHGDPEVFNREIPGVTLRRVAQVRAAPSPRVLMTHSVYRRRIPRAVYMLRDGRDSIVSFFHYTTTREGKAMAFEDWFGLYMSGAFGVRWDQNVESWLQRGKRQLGENLMVLRFEDLRSDTVGCLADVCEFLGLQADKAQLLDAVEAGSLQNGRRWEQHYLGKVDSENASFYRAGQSGKWQDLFSSTHQARFLEASANAMRLGGYL